MNFKMCFKDKSQYDPEDYSLPNTIHDTQGGETKQPKSSTHRIPRPKEGGIVDAMIGRRAMLMGFADGAVAEGNYPRR